MLRALLLIASLIGAIHYFNTRAIEHGAGVLVDDAPVQRTITAVPAIQHRGFTLTPRARITLSARVLSAENYQVDELAKLVPRDLALGWGIMSDSGFLSNLKISQRGRFFFWEYHDEKIQAIVPQIIASSANMHLIGADETTQATIDRVRVGEIIHLEGLLVDVARGSQWSMKTSLSRNDTGGGACEIVYVESARIGTQK